MATQALTVQVVAVTAAGLELLVAGLTAAPEARAERPEQPAAGPAERLEMGLNMILPMVQVGVAAVVEAVTVALTAGPAELPVITVEAVEAVEAAVVAPLVALVLLANKASSG
jgi:hypothetical protein